MCFRISTSTIPQYTEVFLGVRHSDSTQCEPCHPALGVDAGKNFGNFGKEAKVVFNGHFQTLWMPELISGQHLDATDLGIIFD